MPMKANGTPRGSRELSNHVVGNISLFVRKARCVSEIQIVVPTGVSNYTLLLQDWVNDVKVVWIWIFCCSWTSKNWRETSNLGLNPNFDKKSRCHFPINFEKTNYCTSLQVKVFVTKQASSVDWKRANWFDILNTEYKWIYKHQCTKQ